MKTSPAGLWLLLISLVVPAVADTVKDREGAVRQDKAAWENDVRWAYNDVPRGFEEARKSGKPVLVVVRCVPCLSCAGIDASVLTERSLQPLLDQFVCVRVINANALDLSLFQFDFDLSFSTVFLHPDGTVYGRYGSWTHQKNSQDKTTDGFRRAMEAALELHRAYPENKAALAGKRGNPSPYKTPVDIPTLSGKYRLELDWKGKVVPSCVHCHQIGDALRLTYRDKKEAVPLDLIYPMPAPEAVGLTLAADRIATVEAVEAGSIGAKAGFKPGDEIVRMAGQPLVSVADVSWILHRAPATGSLTAVVRRAGVEQSIRLDLNDGWRAKSDISRRVGTWGMRAMATGGLLLEELDDQARRAKGIRADGMALLVKHVGQYGKHAAAKKAGFEKDDVLVEVAGLSGRMSEGELIGHLLRHHRVGDGVKVTVRRNDEPLTLTLPMQ